MPCLCGGCLPWLFASFRCCFFGLFPAKSRLWGTVRLRPFVFFMDSFFFLAGSQARWPYPRNHFYLCLLVARSFCYAAIPTTCFIMPPILPCQASNPSFLANRCLAMLPLCSAPLIALLVAGEDEVCSLLEHVYLLGYHNISYLINASIYLVKGGRLGLMSGVLFHSCRPSFRHTGVMFLDFVFLTRLGGFAGLVLPCRNVL